MYLKWHGMACLTPFAVVTVLTLSPLSPLSFPPRPALPLPVAPLTCAASRPQAVSFGRRPARHNHWHHHTPPLQCQHQRCWAKRRRGWGGRLGRWRRRKGQRDGRRRRRWRRAYSTPGPATAQDGCALAVRFCVEGRGRGDPGYYRGAELDPRQGSSARSFGLGAVMAHVTPHKWVGRVTRHPGLEGRNCGWGCGGARHLRLQASGRPGQPASPLWNTFSLLPSPVHPPCRCRPPGQSEEQLRDLAYMLFAACCSASPHHRSGVCQQMRVGNGRVGVRKYGQAGGWVMQVDAAQPCRPCSLIQHNLRVRGQHGGRCGPQEHCMVG